MIALVPADEGACHEMVARWLPRDAVTVIGAPGAVFSSAATTDGAFESAGVEATGAFVSLGFETIGAFISAGVEARGGDVIGEATIGFEDTLGFTAALGFEVPLLPLLLVAVTVNL